MMMYPTIDVKKEISEAVGIRVKKSPDLFSMQVFHKNSVGRIDAENFIKQGFSKAYGANISLSMPQILTVKNGNFKAALGIRSAKEPLFIEQYLNTPIEQTHALIKENIARSNIVEIGSLYSNAIRFTLPLFLVTAVSLFYKNYQYLTFAGTSHVLNILSKAGVEYSTLCDAKKHALTPSSDDWGSYYETSPKVVVVSLASVLEVIDKQVKYQNLFKSLEKKIADVCQQLAEHS
jgi:hypothetical protein